MKIIIYGFMACGKTTIGKMLSKKLGFKFYDTDEILSKRFKKSVYDIIKSEGIEIFRKKEKKIMDELIKNKGNSIISVGGGMFPLNSKAKKTDIFEFFIDIPYKQLKKRFKKAKTTRPILKKLILKPKKLFKLYKKRLKFYKKADFIIKANNSYNATKKMMKIYENIIDKKII